MIQFELSLLILAFCLVAYFAFQAGKRDGYRNAKKEWETKGRLNGLLHSQQISEEEKAYLIKYIREGVKAEASDDPATISDCIKKMRAEICPSLKDVGGEYYNLVLWELSEAEKWARQLRRSKRRVNKLRYLRQWFYRTDKHAGFSVKFDQTKQTFTITFEQNPSPLRAYQVLRHQMMELISGNQKNVPLVGKAYINYDTRKFSVYDWRYGPMIDAKGLSVILNYDPARHLIYHPDGEGIYADIKV